METSAALASVGTEETAELRRKAADYNRTKVMVAIDDSDESFYALEWVLETLLEQNGDEEYSSYSNLVLTIIHVVEPFLHYAFPGAHTMYPTTSIIRSVNKAQQESASEILTRAVDMCAQRNVEAKALTRQGDPKEVICDAADQMHIDLIVIGSRGLGKIKRAFLGSVSDHVIHHATCPVLVVKTPNDLQ